jgi:hypothetical protein
LSLAEIESILSKSQVACVIAREATVQPAFGKQSPVFRPSLANFARRLPVLASGQGFGKNARTRNDAKFVIC